ncbi:MULTISPECIES: deaminase domain-containing protein [Paenibacillus]|uniref:Uncharacterized protein n=2 Tax=Paenibacillus TaxID=44249 RepID=A0ABX2Z5D0_PAEPO|nr:MULTISPECIES: deaminase domain-containing protein [Paenibacillus]MDR6777038.1 hypothetical protein [Paenibacillus peoriae]ODA06432.1 hypothetical protein A7312_16235 [Paenibacillus polymyxa]OME71726.1 hypothetical protein BK119_08920 [Paenibacillus peoriae]
MKASLVVEHYTSCDQGYILKRKFLDWQNMIVSLWRNRDIGKDSLKDHLTRNYAVGMILSSQGYKYFYSTCRISNSDAKNHLKNIIRKYTNSEWNDMINALYLPSESLLFNYIEVDRSRGIRTSESRCRKHDSESVILEAMTKYMFQYRIFDCNVFIYTQKEPCLNCEMIFQQFIDRHPLINFTLFYNQVNYIALPSKYRWASRKERG